ncbi:ABC transporter permease [Arthrobacter agilis]|uniref:ABC transporter permease n=1 Tax=Arthrobacter agilis TaxID=37921 RepID=UPI0023671FD5|nr:ABC transporter permease [Arthrobacter agilis]WDF33328.1 ABC transporter permease [Arthrobacter agilis]
MATPTSQVPPAQRPRRQRESGSGVNFGRVLKSEWIKVTTIPSTVILIATTVIVMVGIAALLAWQTTFLFDAQSNPEMAAQMQGAPDAAEISRDIPGSGLIFGQLLMASLAVVLIASEWGTGMIRSTMVAVPNRTSALLAKQLIMAVISFLVGAGSALIGYFIAQPILGSADLGFSLDADGALLHIINTGSVLALVSVFAMSVGTLIRNTAGGVVTSIGVLLVLPILVAIFGGSTEWVADAARFLPSSGGEQMVATTIQDGDFNQWQGALILGGWSLLLLAVSLVVTKKRDV